MGTTSEVPRPASGEAGEKRAWLGHSSCLQPTPHRLWSERVFVGGGAVDWGRTWRGTMPHLGLRSDKRSCVRGQARLASSRGSPRCQHFSPCCGLSGREGAVELGFPHCIPGPCGPGEPGLLDPLHLQARPGAQPDHRQMRGGGRTWPRPALDLNPPHPLSPPRPPGPALYLFTAATWSAV